MVSSNVSLVFLTFWAPNLKAGWLPPNADPVIFIPTRNSSPHRQKPRVNRLSGSTPSSQDKKSRWKEKLIRFLVTLSRIHPNGRLSKKSKSTGLWGKLEQAFWAQTCVLTCNSLITNNTFRQHNTKQKAHNLAKKDEKEWPDSTKDAKQMGTSSKACLINLRINSGGILQR